MLAPGVEIELVSDYGRFLELKTEWDELLSGLGAEGSVFLSHFWHGCWWRHFGRGARLHVLVLRKKGEVVAIAPLIFRRIWLYGFPVRSLCFPENGNTLHSDLLVQKGEREEALRTLLLHLYQNRREWDLVQLYRLPADSPNLAGLIGLLGEQKPERHHLRRVYASPYLEVDGGWECFHGARSARTRKTLRNVQNTLEKGGDPELLLIDSFQKYLEHRASLQRIASRSWTHETGDSLATPANSAFFDDLAEAASAEGALRVWLLLLEGRPVAFEFHLRGFGKEHAMRASFDQQSAQLSPGAFLEMELLKRLFDEPDGVERFDFGGSNDPYKRRWCDQARELVLLQLFNRRLYSRLCAIHATSLVPALRGVRDRLRGKR